MRSTAGEIVELLPRLSPSLSRALLHFLQQMSEGTASPNGVVTLPVQRIQQAELCEGFAAELKELPVRLQGAVPPVEGGSDGSDVILQQLLFCLLLALAPSLPNAVGTRIFDREHYPYGGEQAVEVLYSALASQQWSNGVRGLEIIESGAFGTDGGCERLARLLESGHCKLQHLEMSITHTSAGGMRHIARALKTNHSLQRLYIIGNQKFGDGGLEELAAMLRTNCTLLDLTLTDIGMTAHGLGHLCAAVEATSSSPSGTVPVGGLKRLDMSLNPKVGEGGLGAKHLGAMLANNTCLTILQADGCSLMEEEGHLAMGLRENSTLQELDISGNPLGGWVANLSEISHNPQGRKVGVGLLVRSLATNNNTGLKKLTMNYMKEVPAAEELAHMIVSNHSLEHLSLGEASYDGGEWATVILPALGRNKTLQSIELWRCPGLEGEQVRAALFHLLRINTTIRQINLSVTPLDKAGEAWAVEVELNRSRAKPNRKGKA